MRARRTVLPKLLLSLASLSAGADEIITGDAKFSVDISPAGDLIVMDILGDVWTLPADGGAATRLIESDTRLSRPRWSPDGTRVLYHEETETGTGIWIAKISSGETKKLEGGYMQDGSWHPDGERIVYASGRNGTGLDIWETDLPTGLAWRLTNGPGDETSPVWSATGRHLAWIRKHEDRYELRLRRRGEAEITLVDSPLRLSALSWRPDGSLLTFQRHHDDRISLEMVILAQPVLVRPLDGSEKMIAAPVSWRNRMNMLYTADSTIRMRGFADRRSRPLHFRAIVQSAEEPPAKAIVHKELEVVSPPEGRLIIRGTRLFDGIWKGYRQNMDVVIEAGRILAVEPRRTRDDGVVLDLGNVTIMPGLIDAQSGLIDSPAFGPAMLSYGVTTIVAAIDRLSFDPIIFEGEVVPGPRLLQVDPDQSIEPIVSVADAGSPGIGSLLKSRQAIALGHQGRPLRRFPTPPDLSALATPIVAGSRANQMAPGLALHAELRALQAAGLNGEQVLHAAGKNPAVILGIENQVGTITPGALADLILVNGDPLHDSADALNIVAVIRNGRFFSVVSLLERADTAQNVE